MVRRVSKSGWSKPYKPWINRAFPRPRKKNTESLRGPVSAIRNLKHSKQACTVYDFLSALQDSGSQNRSLTSCISLNMPTRMGGEKLFNHMKCSDKIMHQVLLKKYMETRSVKFGPSALTSYHGSAEKVRRLWNLEVS